MMARYEFSNMIEWAGCLDINYRDMFTSTCTDVDDVICIDIWSKDTRGLIASWNCDTESGWVEGEV
jgi:hypothetical protein